MSVSTRDNEHNKFCREPDAGKLHVRICAGIRLVRGVSTHHVLRISFETGVYLWAYALVPENSCAVALTARKFSAYSMTI